jgi:uncharacterized protein YciI
MFIVSLTYTAPLEHIDAHLPAHREFLGEQYARGVFLMSGPKEPRIGGIIVAHAGSRAEVEDLVRQDPFHRAGIARYEITEFVPTMAAELLSAYKES